MCIAIIQHSKHEKYAYFVAINREELYHKRWLEMDFHWQEYPNCKGYLDIDSGGTWLAHNNTVLALLINKESNDKATLKTRGFIVLESLKNSASAYEAIKNLSKLDVDSVKPFNVVFIDSKDVWFASNTCDDKILKIIDFKSIKDDLIVLNRTFPNDVSQIRVKNAFNNFENLPQPQPELHNWTTWENELTKESIVVKPEDEQTLWLNANQWGTLQSDIIAISYDETERFHFHQVKKSNNL